MEKIDWDKAPEGYPLWIHDLKPSRTLDQSGWHRDDGDRYTDESGRYWYKIDDGSYSVYQRPSPSWSGEGLPPVGVVCEWEHEANKGIWHKAEIKYVGSTYLIVADFAGIEQHYYLRNMLFRPIRTHEQIANDEREAAVAAMLELDPYLPNTALGMMSRADFCRALHEAGYRKQDAK